MNPEHDIRECTIPFCHECKEVCLTKTLLFERIIDLQVHVDKLESRIITLESYLDD